MPYITDQQAAHEAGHILVNCLLTGAEGGTITHVEPGVFEATTPVDEENFVIEHEIAGLLGGCAAERLTTHSNGWIEIRIRTGEWRQIMTPTGKHDEKLLSVFEEAGFNNWRGLAALFHRILPIMREYFDRSDIKPIRAQMMACEVGHSFDLGFKMHNQEAA